MRLEEASEWNLHLFHLAQALGYETQWGGWANAHDIASVITRHLHTSPRERDDERTTVTDALTRRYGSAPVR
jgi:hypothetical protein